MVSRLTVSLCFVVVLSISIPTNADLVGYWNFDDNTEDHSGNGNHGSIEGGVSYDADVPGALGAGTSASFDGAAGTFVNVTQAAGLPITTQNAFTISMWVKGDGTVNNVDDRIFSEGMSTNNNPLFNLGTKNNGSDALFDFFFRNGGSPGHLFSDGDVFDDTWRHLAWVDVDHNGTLYIDGVADKSFDYASYVNDGFAPNTTTIGGILRATDCCNYTGLIDDVAIYSTALSADQVGALAGGAAPPTVPEPSSLVLVVVGLLGLLRVRRSR